MNISSSTSLQAKDPLKSCTGCQTTRTPLWRGGPAGPRSLCNACGIRYRKRRRAALGLNKGDEADDDRSEKKTIMSSSSNSNKLGMSLKLGLITIQRDFVFEESVLKEEEQAAIMLMALSCGSVKQERY
ncbi:hypothetical protein FNV43_RR23601 [Rhamnella rubrinervis]|uniref:GATA-type domain-containing protein n=1 Tax=Rhamnella rubrinervis TaxID=2594499 RepID=A0A8K0GS82_9ROSA|nr:hypothetical protein FNV43_RR23601 [Rhamnella rubrinervis]